MMRRAIFWKLRTFKKLGVTYHSENPNGTVRISHSAREGQHRRNSWHICGFGRLNMALVAALCLSREYHTQSMLFGAILQQCENPSADQPCNSCADPPQGESSASIGPKIPDDYNSTSLRGHWDHGITPLSQKVHEAFGQILEVPAMPQTFDTPLQARCFWSFSHRSWTQECLMPVRGLQIYHAQHNILPTRYMMRQSCYPEELSSANTMYYGSLSFINSAGVC